MYGALIRRALGFGALVAWLPAAAQSGGGAVRGAVRDPKGAPIRGAVVGIPGTTLFGTTDAAGRYRLAPVPTGAVRVRAAAIGYAPASAAVTLAAGDSATADFTLDLSPFELTPLDVVSTKVPRFGDRPATSVAQMTDAGIASRAVNTVDEAVDRVAGVQMLNGQINVRGSTGYVQGLNSRVLLLVDGMPMNQGDRGGINWDLLPVDQIERVDVLKGAGSSLYGSAALGGVVNLTTRDVPVGVHGRARLTGGAYADPPHPEWRFRGATGLHGGADVSASYGTETLGARVAVGARHTDGYREQDERDHWQLATRGRWQASPRTRVDVSGAWAVDQYQVPLSWCVRAECDDRGQVYQPFKVDTTERSARTDSRKGYVAAQVRTVASERLAWQARGSWLRTHFTDWRRTASEFSVSNRFGAEVRAEAYPDSARTALVGAEATFSDLRSDIFSGAATVGSVGTHSQSEVAAFGESEQRIGAGRLTAGARLDFLAVDGGSLTAVVSPRIGATLPIAGGSLRGSVGRGFRAPTMAERFVHTVVFDFEVIPNPNLRPETAWSVELGHTTPVLGALRLDAALFWTEARELIEPQLVVVDSTPKIQLQNVTRARIAGLDATVLAAPVPEHLTATLAYTYLDTRPTLAFRPRHLLTLGADYTVGAGVAVGADFRYASRPDRIELEGFVDERRVPVTVIDLRAAGTRGPLVARLLVANVLNYIYNLVPETLAPVRTVSVILTWSY